jgi:hypothetical protein
MVADCGIYRNDKVFAYADDGQEPEKPDLIIVGRYTRLNWHLTILSSKMDRYYVQPKKITYMFDPYWI